MRSLALRLSTRPFRLLYSQALPPCCARERAYSARTTMKRGARVLTLWRKRSVAGRYRLSGDAGLELIATRSADGLGTRSSRPAVCRRKGFLAPGRYRSAT